MWVNIVVAKEESHLLPTRSFSVAERKSLLSFARVKPSQTLAGLAKIWLDYPLPWKHTTSPLQTWVVFPQPVAPLTTITLFLFAASINADLY